MPSLFEEGVGDSWIRYANSVFQTLMNFKQLPATSVVQALPSRLRWLIVLQHAVVHFIAMPGPGRLVARGPPPAANLPRLRGDDTSTSPRLRAGRIPRSPSLSSYDYDSEYDDGPGVGKVYWLELCWQPDEKKHIQKIWTGDVAIVGMLKPEEIILHSHQGWSTVSVGLIPVDADGSPRLRPPLVNRRVGYWPSRIPPHGYSNGIAFFARPHVLKHVHMMSAVSWPEGGGAGVASPSVHAYRLVLDEKLGGRGCQTLRVITVVVDGEHPRFEHVRCAGAMIVEHSPCLCFILQLQGDMTASIPSAIANAARGSRAEVLMCNGSVALVVGSAVAAKSDTKHPELMETTYRPKDWTCKRGEVEAVVVHFDFGGDPRGDGRQRR